jgi:hypothetical protein
MTAFSVLDLSPIVEGGNARRALQETTELARAAERLGYTRFWLAEHHNMPGIASAATAVVLAHVAAATRTIGPDHPVRPVPMLRPPGARAPVKEGRTWT